ncbi:MMPL family transporter [Micromonospora trifolii]|uniref:MMPL family transporter n=1 Tax=Micromonospora trifolii TaxID=2911208 RepID=UPI003D2F4769
MVDSTPQTVVIQVQFLTEMGFAVSVGIVLSAFIMSLLLDPGITALLGHTAWWPGHGDATRSDPSATPAGASPSESAITSAH